MAKLKVSIALAIAVAALASGASAQVPAQAPGSPEGPAGNPAVDAPASSPPAPAPANAAQAPAAPPATNPPTWVGAAPVVQGGTQAPQYGTPAPAGEWRSPEPSTPARTYEYRFTTTLDVVNVLWRSGGGYRLFADNDRAWRIALGLGYDLLNLPEHWILAIEAGYLAEPSHGTEPSSMGGSLTGSVSASTLLMGSSLRWAITPWMAPYGRVGLLASRIAMDFDATATSGNLASSGASWTHHKWTEGGLLGAGVMLNMLPNNRVAAGLLVEGGLWLQKSVEMRLDRDLPAGAIATTGARIGTLENTGPYLRLAGVLRF